MGARCLYCAPTGKPVAASAGLAPLVRDRPRSDPGAWVALYLAGRSSDDAALQRTLTELVGDPLKARGMLGRGGTEYLRYGVLAAAEALAASASAVGIAALAFAASVLDEIPHARTARSVTATDEGLLEIAVEDDVLEIVIDPAEVGLVYAGRVREEPATRSVPDPPARRSTAPVYAGMGLGGALASGLLGAARALSEPSAQPPERDRKMVIDLHGDAQMPIRMIEARTRVTGPGFPTAARQAAEAALLRWLAERGVPVDRSYDDELRFAPLTQPAPELDLLSARAWTARRLGERAGLVAAREGER